MIDLVPDGDPFIKVHQRHRVLGMVEVGLLQNSVEELYILVTQKKIFHQRWVGMRSNTNKQVWESRYLF